MTFRKTMESPFKSFGREVSALLCKAYGSLGLDAEPVVETPPDPSMGDSASPCFNLAKLARKSPVALASGIANAIRGMERDTVYRVEAAGPYVNFFINEERVVEMTMDAISKEGDRYGVLPPTGNKVILEHTSANPNGPFHVGRARNPIIGDTLVRIFRKAGNEVDAQFYVDDMGKQVAILAWGVNNLKPGDITAVEREKHDHKLVVYYQKANALMGEDEKVKAEIHDLLRRTEECEPEALDYVTSVYTGVLEGMVESMERMNVRVDSFIPESNVVKDGSTARVIEALQKSGYAEKEPDSKAWGVDMAQFGVTGRSTKFYFVRSDGTSLYATRDIAYHLWKSEHCDRMVNVLGEDHRLEAKQVAECLKLVGAGKLPEVVFYSFVSLPEGKMSTRRGRVVFLDDLLDEAVGRAYDEVKARRGDELSEDEMRRIAESVGIGAVRYNIVKVQPEKAITFKWEEALAFDGQTAPFIQYSHARCASILRKAKEAGALSKPDSGKLFHPSEIDLVKSLAKLPDVIGEAAETCKPHAVATYAYEVAANLNVFYRDCQVIGSGEFEGARLSLIGAAKAVLANTLDTLGIDAIETM
ncbi:MAG: arginine--tRNA ligase [Thermoplasmata archaeon HGW-Thermoplasmata-1]|nr:MAG: arginine--tRNA ligase [Thermoplasmata archaeon HGW-Thermoplasmata-1]